MNPATEELTGYSLQDAQEKRITTQNLYPPGQAREIMNILRDENKGGRGKLHPSRFTVVDARGDEIPVELTAAIIYDGSAAMIAVVEIWMSFFVKSLAPESSRSSSFNSVTS